MKTTAFMVFFSLIGLQTAIAQEQEKNLSERAKEELALVDLHIMMEPETRTAYISILAEYDTEFTELIADGPNPSVFSKVKTLMENKDEDLKDVFDVNQMTAYNEKVKPEMQKKMKRPF